MPFPNEHAVRVNDPKKYTRVRRQNNKFGQGIDVIFGVLPDGATEVQAIRFRKSKFTTEQAKKWLKDHPEHKGTFEPASNDSNDPVMRYETFHIDASNYEETPEGFLKIDAPVSRSGVFRYRNLDGSVRRELRHPDHVFKNDSLSTLKQIPVTNDHPAERVVNISNAKEWIIGTTGENVRVVGKQIRCNFIVTDSDGIKAIKQGKRQLSTGYSTLKIVKPGTYNGEQYDEIQTNVKYNHVAICNSARGGKELQINIDSYDCDDAVIVEDENDDKNIINQKKGVTMPKIRIDNIEYEAAQEVINSYVKLTENVDSLNKELETQKAASSKIAAEKDAVKEEYDKFVTDSKKDFATKVKSRMEIEKVAEKVFKKEDEVNVDALSDEELKKQILIKKYPNSKEKILNADNNYIDARYDIMIENVDSNDDDSFARQRKFATKNDSPSSKERTSLDARKKMITDLETAYQKDK